jgi:hypothetical protein
MQTKARMMHVNAMSFGLSMLEYCIYSVYSGGSGGGGGGGGQARSSTQASSLC